jgi:cytochrome c-type biogenesis protein
MAIGVGYIAAFGGGIVSFLSPCVLPLVPAYLSVVSGLDTKEITSGDSRDLRKIALSTALFIAGFGAVFVVLGLSASALGRAVFSHHTLITRISGVLLIVMAVFLISSVFLKLPWLYQEKRFHPRLAHLGNFAAPVAGMAFGFGWTPCIGPILGSVLTLASIQGKTLQGGLLLGAYSLGLGIPFLITGLAFAKVAGALAWVKRHFTVITASSATVLGLFGVLLALNDFTWITAHLQSYATSVGLGSLNSVG